MKLALLFPWLIGCAAAGLSAPQQDAPAASERPNVVFVLADDLGWADLGCFGSTFYETPALDALAERGGRFTQAYAACPVCSPTRASILTGRHPARMKTTNWFGGRNRGLLDAPENLHHLPLEEITLAERLRDTGYRTAFFGKWHLGGAGFHPEQQGFDHNVGGDRWGSPASYFWPYRRKNRVIPGLEEGGHEGEHLADRLTSEAIETIDTFADDPFLLYVSYYSVHTPLQAKPELKAKYEAKREALPEPDGPRWKPEGQRRTRQVQDHAVYAGMIEAMDTNVGRLWDALAERDLLDRTIFVFFSDNGGLSTSEGHPTSNLPLRAGKGWLFEGGVREPMVAYWPGVIEGGATIEQPVFSTDFYPTLLAACGVDAPADVALDGVDLGPSWRGEAPAPTRDLCWHYPHYSNQGGRPSGAIRRGDWKLIEHFESGRLELYDLSVDLGEQRDLVAERPEVAAELRTALQEWREHVDAGMPTPNPDWVPR